METSSIIFAVLIAVVVAELVVVEVAVDYYSK